MILLNAIFSAIFGKVAIVASLLVLAVEIWLIMRVYGVKIGKSIGTFLLMFVIFLVIMAIFAFLATVVLTTIQGAGEKAMQNTAANVPPAEFQTEIVQ